jgi:hypothetical protein
MWVRKNQQEIRRAKLFCFLKSFLFCFIISAAGFIFHERTGSRRLGYVAGRSWDFIISELPVFFMVSAGISLLLSFIFLNEDDYKICDVCNRTARSPEKKCGCGGNMVLKRYMEYIDKK